MDGTVCTVPLIIEDKEKKKERRKKEEKQKQGDLDDAREITAV